jgi:hypothetical protein
MGKVPPFGPSSWLFPPGRAASQWLQPKGCRASSCPKADDLEIDGQIATGLKNPILTIWECYR